MVVFKQGDGNMRPMLSNFSSLDKRRSMRKKMDELTFNRMLHNREFERISIKSWAHIPGKRYLIDEYKEFKSKTKRKAKFKIND